jgi:cyclophilin family peptidyl-prolyl cis-trans isomerase
MISNFIFCSKHVVFGKVLSGVDLLKKLEAVGSESGVPSCEVKIVDCGEVSGTNTQDKVKGEKGINYKVMNLYIGEMLHALSAYFDEYLFLQRRS